MPIKNICATLALTLGLSACTSLPSIEPSYSKQSSCSEQIDLQEVVQEPYMQEDLTPEELLQQELLAKKVSTVLENVLIGAETSVTINESSIRGIVKPFCEDGDCLVYVQKKGADKSIYVIFFTYNSEGFLKDFRYFMDKDGDGLIDRGEFGVYFFNYLNEHGVPEIKKREIFDYNLGLGLWHERTFQMDYEDTLEELLSYYTAE